jgi:hypothetical protein
MTPTSNTPYPRTYDPLIDGLLSGAYWLLDDKRTITWSLGNNSLYEWYQDGYQVVQAAFDAWEAVINVNFEFQGTYVDFTNPSADIVVTIGDSSFFSNPSTVGMGIFPNQWVADQFLSQYGLTRYYYPHPEGDLFFNIDHPVTDYYNLGSDFFHVVLHEIGHAIGLKHPHDNGLAGYPTYAEAGYDEYDNGYLTLMSYEETSPNWQYGWASTPLPLDILAAQEIYGINPNTNTGDSHHYLYDDGLLRTIYDVSGFDTLDAYYINHGVLINIEKGWWSDLGNFSTVFIDANSEIENAYGTDWADTIYGNELDNFLYGRGGDDMIYGGDGIDYAFYDFRRFDYDITRTSINTYEVQNQYYTENLQDVEGLAFTDYYVNLTVQDSASSIVASALQQLQELYVAFFNRVPDGDGLEYWINQYKSGLSLNDIAEQFYQAGIKYSNVTGFSSSMTNTDFINVVYGNVLGRPEGADEGGLTFWNNALTNGDATKATLVAAILDSAHTYKGDSTWGWVSDLLDNKIEVANTFSVDYGLNYYTSEESITGGMAIAAAVTPDDTSVAIELIGVVV